LVKFRQPQTSPGRRRLAAGIVFGFVAGIVVGLAAVLMAGIAFGIAFGIAAGIMVVGLAAGIMVGLEVNPGEYSVAEPREIIRAGIAAGIVFGLSVGLSVGVAAGVAAGVAFGIGSGITCGITVGLAFGLVGWQYIALLLCTRRWNNHWLPWRLGSFLDWCYQAGLIRIAGIGYQFRHRELQDYLARNPVPPG
jgi:hypothetical protein